MFLLCFFDINELHECNWLLLLQVQTKGKYCKWTMSPIEGMQHVLACLISFLACKPGVRTGLIVLNTLTIDSFLENKVGKSCDVASAKDEHIVQQFQNSVYRDKEERMTVSAEVLSFGIGNLNREDTA